MVAVRFATLRIVDDAECPVCGGLLPPIRLVCRARADGPRTLAVDVDCDLPPEWWDTLRLTHPTCPPDRAP